MVDEPSYVPEPDALTDEQPKRRRFGGRIGLTVALVAGLALAASGVAIAASDPSPKPTPSNGDLPPEVEGFSFAGPDGGALLGPAGIGVMGLAVHGEVTVPKRDGGYQTLKIQRGQVTDVSANSITVKSPDDFTAQYAVDDSTLVDAGRDGIGSIKDGHRVFVVATIAGSAVTAHEITDVTLLSKAFKDLPRLKMHDFPKLPPLPMLPGRLGKELRHQLRQHFFQHHMDSSSGNENSATSST